MSGHVTALSSIPNPFKDSVVKDAWQSAAVDVESINKQAFDVCRRAFQEVTSSPGNGSVLLFGAAGSGKTHLLGRMQRLLISEAARAPDHVLRCVFVSVSLETGPSMLWQYLRQRFVDDLFRVQEGLTQLERLLAHELASHSQESPSHWVRTLRVLAQVEDPELSRYLEEIEVRAQLGRDLRVVLEHLLHKRHISNARAWLRGDYLPNEELRAMGLGPAQDVDADPEDRARRMVLTLCRLTPASLPVVFCFDQVEALQSHSEDREAIISFGRMAADIFNRAANVLIISCIQSAFRDLFEESVRQADFDRIAQREALLTVLDSEQARALVQRRLEASAPLRVLREGRAQTPLWPLTEQDVEAAKASEGVWAPRRLLTVCARRFDALKDMVDQTPPLDSFLTGELEERFRAALGRSPGDTDQILAHGLPFLARLVDPKWRSESQKLPRDIDLRFIKGDQRVDVAFLNQQDARALWRPVQRLSERSLGPGETLVVIRDPRLPLSNSASKTADQLRQLKPLRPTPETLAALQALRELYAQAQSGDLAHAGDPVGPQTIAEWLQGCLNHEVRQLFEDIVEAAGQPVDNVLERLVELLGEEKLIELKAAARRLAQEEAGLEELAIKNQVRVGLLRGPPAVLFLHRAGALKEEGP